MKDSGLDEVFQLIYPGIETVERIMSGAVFYKAIRAYFIVDAALCAFVLKDKFTDVELSAAKGHTVRIRS